MKFYYGGMTADRSKTYAVGERSELKCIDIFDSFWNEWKRANIVFIDFPYDDRMIKHYYEQIDVKTDKTFLDLKNRAFDIIRKIAPERVFVEIGIKNGQVVIDGLREIGFDVRVHNAFYAKKYPCLIVEGCRENGFINYAIHGMDELQSIDNICKNEKGCVCDFFNGQGSVSLSAYKHGLDFVCSELNPNRLGRALYRLEKAGAKIKLE